jgi:hypothetical protein
LCLAPILGNFTHPTRYDYRIDPWVSCVMMNMGGYAMKKNTIVILIGVLFLILLLIGCGPRTGDLEGMLIYVTRSPSEITRSLVSDQATRMDGTSRYFPPDQSADYYQPKDITIGFSKVWFPERSTYDQIVAEETNEIGHDGDCIIIRDRTTIPAEGYFKPVDGFSIVTASTSQPYSPSTLPEYGMDYYGLLIDIVYYEYEMEDFSIRWYVQDHDVYKEKDVVLKGPGTADVWKFPYYHRTSAGVLSFVIEDERKDVLSGIYLNSEVGGGLNTAEGYFCITTDGEQDGPDGIQDAWESFIHPRLIAGYATASNPDPLTNPNTINIFPEAENEAQYYLFQICLNTSSNFSIGRYNGFSMGPGIKPDQTENDSLTYNEFTTIINENLDTESIVSDPLDKFPDDEQIYTFVGPVGSGIETRFGWIDFENNPQGEFSPGAGW